MILLIQKIDFTHESVVDKKCCVPMYSNIFASSLELIAMARGWNIRLESETPNVILK